MSGLILGGLHSSSGKTVVTSMLLAAFAKQGRRVQPFKAGPDFIDPAFHSLFCDRPSRNLDFWLMGGERAVKAEALLYTRACPGIIEGVMGIFDGWSPLSDSESTMHLARLLHWPIVLVVPCAKAGRSLAAALRGFIAEAGEGRIVGVILNQVSGDSHRDYLEQAIKPLGIPVLGALPQDSLIEWPERHLGLQAAQEGDFPLADDLAKFALEHLDVEALWKLTQSGESGRFSELGKPKSEQRSLRVAVARDEAFHFYYPANLDALQVLPFSPLHDKVLPEKIDAVVFGGGFPEVFAEELSANRALMAEVVAAAESGLPMLAECGGLMYLSEALGMEGQSFPMCGLLPGAVEMTKSLQNFGYCESSSGVKGHEFHYSRWLGEEQNANAWQVAKRRTGSSREEGFRIHNIQATYVHSLWAEERLMKKTL
ncbi:MAG: cobyrinate a,c-diamide synthase [Verrucomicrobiales bacterium]|nr:cobyrinate a,c-diamide synthase [Verrucomicrobiales bacterium]